jgi:hypothetical protein
MLNYAGYSFDQWDQESWIREQPSGVTVVIGAEASEGWSEAASRYCEAGNALLAIGQIYGLEKTLGISSASLLNEGWILWGDSLLTKDLKSSFHSFDATLAVVNADDVVGLGQWRSINGTVTEHPAFTSRSIGSGTAAWIGFDLMKTVCLIQQGVAVLRDGRPSPDSSGLINDGILKTDDGSVLDWQYDRDTAPDGTAPFYMHPIVDEMRILLARVLYDLQQQIGLSEAQTWFWPNGLTAIGHISHDTDGNVVELAETMLDKLAEAGVPSTWCTIAPGYPDSIYNRIQQDGHEIALHYNALGSEIPESSWSERDYRYQLDYLQAQVPGYEIVSNKNHYLRWEGDTSFYHWCERSGVRIEQSKGGTKQGNKGFLFGTCHPNVPVSSPAENNRRFNVISLPTLAWDPPIPIRCTADEAKLLLLRSKDVYGVAHFLFHPGAILNGTDTMKAGDFMVELCKYGRELGLEWWTSEAIDRWVRTRRNVRVETAEDEITVESDEAIQGLTVLLHKPDQVQVSVGSDASVVVKQIKPIERFGRSYVELVIDVPQGTSVLKLSAETATV